MQLSRAFATEPPQVRSLKLGILRDIFVQSVVSHRRRGGAVVLQRRCAGRVPRGAGGGHVVLDASAYICDRPQTQGDAQFACGALLARATRAGALPSAPQRTSTMVP
jgi:hypothetical protein